MKYFFTIAWTLLYGCSLLAQASFYHLLPEEDNEGFELIDSLLWRAEWAMNHEYKIGNIVAQEAIRLSEERNAPRRIGYGHFFMGMMNMGQGKWGQAEREFLFSIEYFRMAGDSLSVATAYDRIGYAYRRQGYLNKSLEYHLRGLQRRQDFGAPKLHTGYSYAAVGGIYYALQEYDEALFHYRRAFNIRKAEKDSIGIALSMNGLGRLHRTLGHYDSSYHYLSSALERFTQLSSLSHVLSCNHELGLLYRSTGELPKAQAAFKNGLKVAEQIESQGRAALLQLELGKLTMESGNKKEAKTYFLAAQENFIKTENLEDLQEVNLLLAQLAASEEKYRDAYHYFQNYAAFKDSIFTRESNRALSEARTHFETEQKEKEIALLLEKQKAQNEKQKYRNRERTGLLIGILGLLVFVMALVYSFQQRARAFQRLLQEKNRTDALLKEKEQLFQNLQSAQDQLVQSEKLASLGQLTAGIAHEINNPVNFISSNTFALQMDFEELEPKLAQLPSGEKEGNITFLTTEIKDLIQGIRRGAERTKEIVSNLNTFSRQSDGRYEEADLHEGIDTSITILHNKFKNRITFHKDYGEIPLVECQYLRINQVFLNIINNAIDAIEDEGDIHISTRHVEDQVVIKIKDSGVGMSEDRIRKIFEPFYTSKDVGKGTGLGLSISYGIIQQHNGRIKVNSVLGQGSEFLIYLPVRHVEDQEEGEREFSIFQDRIG